MEAAGAQASPQALPSNCSHTAQATAARHTLELSALRKVLAVRRLSERLAAAHTRRRKAQLTPAATQPTNFLAALRACASTAPEELQRLARDDREVALTLTACLADPGSCRLALTPLASGRTLAALAALGRGQRVAAVRASLQAQLQCGAAQRATYTRLLSSQRAQLLASVSNNPRPNGQAALARVLSQSLHQRRHVAQTRLVQPAAAAATGGGRQDLLLAVQQVQTRRRLQLIDLVQRQHRELKKAWRESRAQEQRDRLAALRSNNVEEYVRLVQGANNSKIDALLSQTDNCLRQLAARLPSPGLGQELLAAGTAASQQAPGSRDGRSSGGSSRHGGIAALEQSHEAWSRLANAFQADVPQQPKLLTGGDLREYQMSGLRWMEGLRRHGLNGILADEMGLGKTIQVIALVCHLVGELGVQYRPTLIAVPSSVLPNWEAELAQWAPRLKVVAYKGAPDQRKTVWECQMARGRGGGAGPGTHVVLTTYEYLMAKQDKPRLSRVRWGHLVVDEGHRLKNAGCKLNAELRAYSTQHRLLLTGTPLQNRLEELWSLLNFLMPALFSSGEDFQQWFGGSERRAGSCRGPASGAAENEVPSDDDESAAAAEAARLTDEEALIVTNRLHQVLRPFMLRRLKETVASELTQKVERLLPVLPSPYQQALFRLMQEEMVGGSLKGVNNVLMEMRNVCNHPLISRLHPEGSEAALPPHSLPAEVRLCGKLELLDRVLVKLKAGGHKVLLFSTMTRALDVVADYLDSGGFTHLRLDGATSAAERGGLVTRFNDPAGGVFVFLLSIRAGGVGLNLQGADTVIMYDTDYNPQCDLQAQARAHRMGQKREVLVLRLKTLGTVEERVVQVAADKALLADRSITGGFFDGKTSAEERQRYLLDTIKASTQAHPSCDAGGVGSDSAGVRGDASGQLSDRQLNVMLARGEEELELFEREDRRLQEAEVASWQAAGAAGAAGAAALAPTSYRRLASEEEVAPLVQRARELLQPKVNPYAGLEMGRGKRQRGTAAYCDIKDRDFNRLCQEVPAGADFCAVQLMAAPSPPLSSQPGSEAIASAARLRRTLAASAAAARVHTSAVVPAEAACRPEAAAAEQPPQDAVRLHAAPARRPLGARKALERRQRQQAAKPLLTLPPPAGSPADDEPPLKRQCRHGNERNEEEGQEGGGGCIPPVSAPAAAAVAGGVEGMPNDNRTAVEPAAKRRRTGKDRAVAEAAAPPGTGADVAATAANASGPAGAAAGVAIIAADGSGPAAAAAAAALGSKHCCNCSSNIVHGGKWRQDPDSGNPLCMPCYTYRQYHKRHRTAEDMAAQLARKQQAATEERKCTHCAVEATTKWRRHPDTRKRLCDKCGTHVRQRGRLPGEAVQCQHLQEVAEEPAPVAAAPGRAEAAVTGPEPPAQQEGPGCAAKADDCRQVAGTVTAGNGNAGEQCSNCGGGSGRHKWRKDPKTKDRLCEPCGAFFNRHKRHRTAEEIAARLAKQAQAASEERRCTHCSATSTGMWRRHPDTRKLLCDSCGRHVRTHGGLPVLEAQGE
ncbi:hypothetical protein D9Q98_003464 [Chlorella vulgaris]|uniref:SNF2 super family n=1 Tax=Chlorella vulgaris TaxID=3077 RepID=A0A9D4YZG2_CHLVU|nr:hypothetical protein D9Q98_003464 [Chlorella vulgaris]